MPKGAVGKNENSAYSQAVAATTNLTRQRMSEGLMSTTKYIN